jgi:hypothetical protein
MIAQHTGAAVLRSTGQRRAEILQEQRHTEERAVAVLTARQLRAGVIEQRDDHRVERRIDPFDGVDRRVEQFLRRTLLRAHQLGLSGRVEFGQLHYLRFAIAFFMLSALLT